LHISQTDVQHLTWLSDVADIATSDDMSIGLSWT
jgi:hypothetical protein